MGLTNDRRKFAVNGSSRAQKMEGLAATRPTMKSLLSLLALSCVAPLFAAQTATPVVNPPQSTPKADAALTAERQRSERLAAEYLAMRKADASYDLAKIFAGKLVDAEGKPVDSAYLRKAKYTMLYFSSYSCGPCHRFTPSLTKFVREHGKDGSIAVVLVSSDRSDANMLTYLKKFEMPWPGMRPAPIRDPKAADDIGGVKTGIEYIPHLRVFDASGKMVFDTFDAKGNRRANGPFGVLDDLKAALSAPVPAVPAVGK